MSNDYFIPFLNICVKTLNDARCETDVVIKLVNRLQRDFCSI